MKRPSKPIIISVLITAGILSGCNNDNTSKKSPELKQYKTVSCKDMLSSEMLPFLTKGSTCGYLNVPEMHELYGESASEKKIDIAVVKLAAIEENKNTDPIVFLQGGPGGSATDSIHEFLESKTFINNRDVYFVDQRGTGYSKPALRCTEYNGEAGTPEQVKACKTRLEQEGVNLNAFNSVQNAMDFIQLRKALSISSWNLYGSSYGTRLATTIMREDSEGIRSVILDGVFPIEVNGISDTPWANYESLNHIIKNCERTVQCNAVDFKYKIEDIISRMHNTNMIRESRIFVQNLLEIAVNSEIVHYVSTVSNDISQYQSAFNAIDMDEERQMIASEEPDDSFYSAMGLSTVCAEEAPFLGITELSNNSSNWSVSTQFAVDGMFHMGFDKASCQVWDVAPANPIETKPVSSDLPVLILNGQNDYQTPAAWGELVAKNMPHSQSVTNPQGEHGQLLAGFQCFESLAEAFLAEPNQQLDIDCVSAIPKVTYSNNENDVLAEAKAANTGYKIAYGDLTKIWMMNPDGTEATELVDASPVSGYVSWGPDADFIYFSSAKGVKESAWEAFRVDVKTKELTQLSNFKEDVRSLGVSPDGQYFAISIMNGNSNIGSNNDDLTQFHTDLYIMNMDTAESIWAKGETITKADMKVLISSPAHEQFWYEELSWSPKLPEKGGLPTLAYSKTWRYDEDDVSFTHVYTIKADGSRNTLIAENKDQPIFDFTGTKITFLDLSYYDLLDNNVHQLAVSGIKEEVSAPAISPDGNFMIFEVGDENRKAGMSRSNNDTINPAVIINNINVYEPRWSPVAVE